MSRSVLASLLVVAVLACGQAEAGATPPAARHALIMVFDGARADVFYRLLDAGRLPNIERHLLRRGLKVENCFTVFPSTTGPAYAPLVTGLWAGKSGLVGNRWYDRTTGKSHGYGGHDYHRINDDLSKRFKTLYELVPGDSLSVFGYVDRGAARSYMAELALVKAALSGDWLDMDRVLFHTFLWRIRKEVPRFMFLSLHGADSSGHAHGIEDARYQAAIVQMDRFVGELAAKLTDLGAYDSTAWVIVADHGHTTIHGRHHLGNYLKKRSGLLVRDSIPRETFLYNVGAAINRYTFDAHMEVSGNSMAQFYLRPRGQDPSTRCTTADVRRFRARSGATVDLEKALLESPAVDVVLSRIAAGRYRVASRDGAAEIAQQGGSLGYTVAEGRDPLGYTDHPVAGRLVGGAFASPARWLEATATTEFPDAPVQIAQLLENPRTGDIVVAARTDYEPWKEGLSGSHGSLRREHMRVPLLLAGPGVRVGTVARARTADIFPTLVQMLGLPAQPGIDGECIGWAATQPPASPAPPTPTPSTPASGPSPRAGTPPTPAPVASPWFEPAVPIGPSAPATGRTAALQKYLELELAAAAGEQQQGQPPARARAKAQGELAAREIAGALKAGQREPFEDAIACASRDPASWERCGDLLESLAALVENPADRERVLQVQSGAVFDAKSGELVAEYLQDARLLATCGTGSGASALSPVVDASAYLEAAAASSRLGALLEQVLGRAAARNDTAGLDRLKQARAQLPASAPLDRLIAAIERNVRRQRQFHQLQE